MAAWEAHGRLTKSASTGRCASSSHACVHMVVGALLTALFFQVGCSRSTNPFAKSRTLSPEELFQKESPSVFVVEALDENGKTLMLGSAVAIARDVLITNCHVVENGSSLSVRRGKETWNGRLIQAVSTHDLCGLRPSGLTLQPVEVRPSSKLATGEHVYAIGSPEGLELTFSEGVISALRETDGVRMIQTSAPISPGSSGGGLFDAQGNLVGVTTFYLKEGQSLNFALPGEWITALLDSLTEVSHKSSSKQSDAELGSKAWLEIGLEAKEKEDYELAVTSFRKCADLKQSDASRAWLELGRIGEEALYAFPTSSHAYNAWFRKFQWSQLEAQESAIAAFEKAIELRPDYAEAWRELAYAHRFGKEYGQAIAAAKEATRLAPREWRGWAILGDCYIKTESYSEAIEALQQGEKVSPDDVQKEGGLLLLDLLGEAYAKKGDREQILRIYQELKNTKPKMAEVFFREYVLPQPSEHPSKQRSKRDSDLRTILRNASTTDDIRDAAWEAFHAAMNADDLVRRLDAIALPNDIKRKIWNLKFGSRTPPTGTAICSTVGADGRRVFTECLVGETQKRKPQQ